MIFEETGIWLTVPFSEAVTVVVAFNYMRKSSDKLSLSYGKGNKERSRYWGYSFNFY